MKAGFICLELHTTCFTSAEWNFSKTGSISAFTSLRRAPLLKPKCFPKAIWVSRAFGPNYLKSLDGGLSNSSSQEPLSSIVKFTHDDLQFLTQIIHGVSGLSSLYILAVILASVVGTAIYVSSHHKAKRITLVEEHLLHGREVIDCILINKPTPFNQFVTARCPSLTFQEADSGASSNKVALEYCGSVSLQNSSNISSDCEDLGTSKQELNTSSEKDGKSLYQRSFIHAEDGGVLAIDWPSDLDLTEELELDTTVILIPGTPAGSRDEIIQNFVCQSVNSGYFPTVLNPRGCAGSPLTTPRLFTAADFDDVRLAVNFISKSRTWTTLMAIGWDYGANMLVKYLADEGEATPLTAAVCICNPFDLEEATNMVRHGGYNKFNEKMIEGLKHILRMNKMLFEGKNKGFDVQKGLTATSIPQFDAAISSIPHGFKSLEEFYEHSSCKSCINEVKIPLLCMQSDEHLPQNIPSLCKLFETNSFTNLLICSKSFLHMDRKKPSMTTPTWYFTFVIEWLAAVEIAFLKGRHPLLQDHLSCKLSKESDIFRRQFRLPSVPVLSGKHRRIGGLDPNQDPATQLGKRANGQLREHLTQTENNNKAAYCLVAEKECLNSNSYDDTESDPQTEEAERGKAEIMAASVMKVLDTSMPGTLSEQQKQQVLAAVGRGETIVSALQAAVPEDVRGKILSGLSGALQERGMKIDLTGLSKIMPTPSLPEGLKEKMQDKLAAIASRRNIQTSTDIEVTNHSDLADSSTEGSESKDIENHATQTHSNVASVTDCNLKEETIGFDHEYMHSSGENHDVTGMEKLQQSANVETVALERDVQETNCDVHDGKAKPSRVEDSSVQDSSITDDESKAEVFKQGNSNQNKTVDEQLKRDNQLEERNSSMHKVQDYASAEGYMEQEKSNQVKGASNLSDKHKEELRLQTDENQNKRLDEQLRTVSQVEENSQKDIEAHKEGKEPNIEGQQYTPDNQGLNMQATCEEQKSPQISRQPSINVQQAWEALGHFDDSTQMAVTNVFGVIENMIERLQKENKTQQNVGSHLNVDNQHLIENKSCDEDSKKVTMQMKEKNLPMANNVVSLKVCENGNARPRHQYLDNLCESETMQNKDGRIQANAAGYLDFDADNKLLARCSDESDDQKMVQSQALESKTVKDRDGVKNGTNANGTNAVSRLSERCSEETINQKMVQKQPSLKTVEDEDMTGYKTVSKFAKLNLEKRPKEKILEKKSDNMPKVIDSQDSDVPLEYCPNEEVWKYSSTVGSPEKYSPFMQKISNQKYKHENAKQHIDKDGSHEEFASSTIFGDHRRVKCQTSDDLSQVVEPSYVILDDEPYYEELDGYFADDTNECTHSIPGVSRVQDSILDYREYTPGDMQEMIQDIIVNALEEAFRYLERADIDGYEDALGEEIIKVATALSEAILKHNQGIFTFENEPRYLMVNKKSNRRLGLLNRKEAICTINSLLCGSEVLLKILPQKILVEVILTALDTIFFVNDDHKYFPKDGQVGGLELKDKGILHPKKHEENCDYGVNGLCQHDHNDIAVSKSPQEEGKLSDYGEVVGAMATAVSTTTALAQGGSKLHGEITSGLQTTLSINEKSNDDKPNIMSSFAEKAMSVAAPVVPTKEDGEVDHDRLVAILADLGQKGGMLRFIGKAALLWGGLRGAMSLTEKLLVFLHLSERPLHQRLAGFVVMTLLLWSPVVVPLLPALLQQWSFKTIGGGVAECTCMVGLYVAVIILITIWGKRIRGYDQPLSHYGLRVFSRSKLLTLASGLTYGCTLVVVFYGICSFFNLLHLTMPASISISSFKNYFSILKAFWSSVILVGRAFVTGIAFATIEELLFRSWLVEEIAVDLGLHKAILLSGLCFSIVHWSFQAVPGLWLLSLILSAVKLRSNGELALPIGIHAGLISGNYILVSGDFIKYSRDVPHWITGAHAGNPLTGALGLFIVAILTMLLYPWKQVLRASHLSRSIVPTKSPDSEAK